MKTLIWLRLTLLIITVAQGLSFAGEPATAAATVTAGFVTGITLTSGGAGYVNEPAVTINGGGGTGATAKALVTGERVSAIILLTAGSGYTTAPIVEIEKPPQALSLSIRLIPEISINGYANGVALVDSSESPEGPWQILETVTATKNTNTVFDLTPAASTKYYRVRNLPVGTILWRFNFGQSWNSWPLPVLPNDDFIYYGAGKLRRISAISGKIKWETQSKPIDSALVLSGNNVFGVAANDGNTYPFNVDTGAPGNTIKIRNQVGSAAPLVRDGVAYQYSGYTYVEGRDINSAVVNFSTFLDSGDGGWSSLIFGTSTADWLVAASKEKLLSINAKSGTEMWRLNLSSQTITCTPALSNENNFQRIYVGDRDGYLYCIRSETGEIIWKNKTAGDISQTPVLGKYGDVVTTSYPGVVNSFDAATGSLRWTHRFFGDNSTPVDYSGFSNLSVDDHGNIICSCQFGLFSIDGSTGQKRMLVDGRGSFDYSEITITRSGIIICVTKHEMIAVVGEAPLASSPWPKFRKSYSNNQD
jgi:outer membrane protein assembly factor BamB